MPVATFPVSEVCPKNPDGVHGWSLFEGGMGCLYCEAWRFLKVRDQRDDPDPTTAILQPVTPDASYGEDVEQADLDISVMNAILPIAGPCSFAELEAVAHTIIEIVQARS